MILYISLNKCTCQLEWSQTLLPAVNCPTLSSLFPPIKLAHPASCNSPVVTNFAPGVNANRPPPSQQLTVTGGGRNQRPVAPEPTRFAAERNTNTSWQSSGLCPNAFCGANVLFHQSFGTGQAVCLFVFYNSMQRSWVKWWKTVEVHLKSSGCHGDVTDRCSRASRHLKVEKWGWAEKGGRRGGGGSTRRSTGAWRAHSSVRPGVRSQQRFLSAARGLGF